VKKLAKSVNKEEVPVVDDRQEIPQLFPDGVSHLSRIEMKIDVEFPWGWVFSGKKYYVHKDICKVLSGAGDCIDLTPKPLANEVADIVRKPYPY